MGPCEDPPAATGAFAEPRTALLRGGRREGGRSRQLPCALPPSVPSSMSCGQARRVPPQQCAADLLRQRAAALAQAEPQARAPSGNCSTPFSALGLTSGCLAVRRGDALTASEQAGASLGHGNGLAACTACTACTQPAEALQLGGNTSVASSDAVVGLGPQPLTAPLGGWPVPGGGSRTAAGIGDRSWAGCPRLPAHPLCLCFPDTRGRRLLHAHCSRGSLLAGAGRRAVMGLCPLPSCLGAWHTAVQPGSTCAVTRRCCAVTRRCRAAPAPCTSSTWEGDIHSQRQPGGGFPGLKTRAGTCRSGRMAVRLLEETLGAFVAAVAAGEGSSPRTGGRLGVNQQGEALAERGHGTLAGLAGPPRGHHAARPWLEVGGSG